MISASNIRAGSMIICVVLEGFLTQKQLASKAPPQAPRGEPIAPPPHNRSWVGGVPPSLRQVCLQVSSSPFPK